MRIEKMEKISLGRFPTPLEPMTNLSRHLGRERLYIKRDDETGLGLSGNKVRKLEYLVKDAMNKGCNTLLTYGGPQTNHGRLTAAAAAKCGMKSVLLLMGERPEYCSGNLVLDALLGSDVRFFSGGGEAEITESVVEEYRRKGDTVYVIPGGGSNETGAAGYINMIPELMKQTEALGIESAVLVCSYGSMGTYSGLWTGIKYYGAPYELVGVPVSPDMPRGGGEAAAFVSRLSEFYDMGIKCRPEDVRILFSSPSSGLGYNIPDDNTRANIKLMAETEAIFLDPCYTGKSFGGYLELLGEPGSGDKTFIFIHTGGSPALWSREHLDASQTFYGY